MKIDRLIGILSVLLQQEKTTAPALAEKFEVSRRTINRDIEDLCRAGIPIVTMQGQNGGISIMEGYKIEKTLLTSSDMQYILSGLKSLDSISGTNRYRQLMEKLSAGNSDILASNNHILIDLSSWYKSSLAPKIELIQEAVERHELIAFTYYGPGGEGNRKIEPYLLVFYWSSWYVWGYCLARQSYRMFKLNRITGLKNIRELYEKRQTPEIDFSNPNIFSSRFQVKALFEPTAKWRLVEDYGIESFTERRDKKLDFCFSFSDENNLFSWLLSFGNQVELVEPTELREKYAVIVKEILNKYR